MVKVPNMYTLDKIRQFNFVRRLKKNKISSIWLVKTIKEKTFHVLKVTNKVEAMRKNCQNLPINEQTILSKLKHCLIANIIEAFQDNFNLYILLEYMPYGSLRDYLRFVGNLT